jgi:ribonuclease E
LRLVEEEVMKEFTGQVIVQAPVAVSNFLLNEKRSMLNDIEARHKVPVVLVGNKYMETPAFEVARVRKSEMVEGQSSLDLVQAPPRAELVANEQTQAAGAAFAPPVVRAVAPTTPAPSRPDPEEQQPQVAAQKKAPGLFARLAKIFTAGEAEIAQAEAAAPTPNKRTSSASMNRSTPSQRSSDSRSSDNAEQRKSRGKTGKKTGKKMAKKTAKKAPRKADDQASAQAGPQQAAQQGSPESGGEGKKKARRSRGGRKRGGKGRNKQQADGVNQPDESNRVAPVAAAADNPGNVVDDDNRGNVKVDSGNNASSSEGEKRQRRRRGPYSTNSAQPRKDNGEGNEASNSGSSADGDTPAAKAAPQVEARAPEPVQAATPPAPSESQSKAQSDSDRKGLYTLKPSDADAPRPGGD